MAPSVSSPLWVVSLDDPRAPPTDVWNAMSEAERQAVLDALPSEFPAEQQAREAEQKAREAEQKARERAEAKLREQGINPDEL